MVAAVLTPLPLRPRVQRARSSHTSDSAEKPPVLIRKTPLTKKCFAHIRSQRIGAVPLDYGPFLRPMWRMTTFVKKRGFSAESKLWVEPFVPLSLSADTAQSRALAMGAEEWGGQWSLTLQNRNSFLLSKPTNLKKITLSIS